MWLAKETAEKIPSKGGAIEAGSTGLKGSAVNVLLIGGSRLLQESVVQLLDDSRFSVVKCVETLDQATTCLRQSPDRYQMLIFQLVEYNDARFFERLAEIRRAQADMRLVLLAWPIKELTFLTHSFDIGVDAYLESTTSQEGLRQSLDMVVSGERIFPARLKDTAMEPGYGTETAQTGLPSNLSARELEILRHLASGRANKVIANELRITEATVKVHVKGILRKIGATNRTQAAIWALHNGLRPIYIPDENTVN